MEQRFIHWSVFEWRKQTMTLKKQVHRYWVKHWNQTQRSLHLTWIVKTKEHAYEIISVNNSLLKLSSNLQAIRYEKEVQHHWAMHWNQTQHSLHFTWNVSAKEQHTNNIRQRSTFPFSSNRQQTWFRKQEQYQWAKHWSQTQHSQNWTWEVKTNEAIHKWRPSTIHSFFHFH